MKVLYAYRSWLSSFHFTMADFRAYCSEEFRCLEVRVCPAALLSLKYGQTHQLVEGTFTSWPVDDFPFGGHYPPELQQMAGEPSRHFQG